jgi:hypothetical protein
MNPVLNGGDMLRRSIIASLVLLIALAAFAQNPQQAMKGYELYSWKRDGIWYYSLVAGTNRSRSYEEVTSEKNTIKGTSALRAQLERLPKGTEVIWTTGIDPSVIKSATGKSPKLELPSGERVRKIKKYCDKIGIKLTLG